MVLHNLISVCHQHCSTDLFICRRFANPICCLSKDLSQIGAECNACKRSMCTSTGRKMECFAKPGSSRVPGSLTSSSDWFCNVAVQGEACWRQVWLWLLLPSPKQRKVYQSPVVWLQTKTRQICSRGEPPSAHSHSSAVPFYVNAGSTTTATFHPYLHSIHHEPRHVVNAILQECPTLVSLISIANAALQNGDHSKAGNEKYRLEEMQRCEKRVSPIHLFVTSAAKLYLW